MLLDTSQLAPGEYGIAVDGKSLPDLVLFLVPIERRSAASLQDESFVADEPQLTRQDRKEPELLARKLRDHRAEIAQRLQESA